MLRTDESRLQFIYYDNNSNSVTNNYNQNIIIQQKSQEESELEVSVECLLKG